MGAREQVDREQRHGGHQRERREQADARQRQQQREQVADAAVVERDLQDVDRVREDHLHRLRGRAADILVAAVEAQRRAVPEVRRHEGDDHGGQHQSGRRDAEPELVVPAPERVPEPHPGHDQRHLLARRARDESKDAEQHEPVFVQKPEGVEQQRTGECPGVELVEREPLQGRIDQVDEREPERGPLGAEVLAAEPEDGECAARESERLDGYEHVRARPDEPERREHGQDRLEVRSEPRDLLAVEVGLLEEAVAVRRRPDRLDDVAEVEAPSVERAMAKDRERGEHRRKRDHPDPDQCLGRREPELHATPSRTSRHRWPSTSSLARRS